MSQTATRSARKLEIYTRVSLYAMLGIIPVVYVGAFPTWGTGAVAFVVGVVQAAASMVVCSRTLTMLQQGRRSPTRREGIVFGVWLAFSALVLIMMAAQVAPGRIWMPAVCTAAAAPLATVAALLSARAVLAVSVVLAAVLGVLAGTRGAMPASASFAFAIGAALLLVILSMSFWLSGWLLRNIWELEEARRTAAQLAIAEERLRISRDLHDLFGRTMATVAVKTELAGELVRRGQSDAALVQLGEVRQIAEQTGQQVRGVVQGYRDNDLATELLGARSLLDAAGIRCVVRGSAPEDLDQPTVSALVWVLREAVTNVIRHSTATECLITIDGTDTVDGTERVRIMITNDGAVTSAERNALAEERFGGHGLIGMRERVSAVAGELRTLRDDDSGRFTVEMTVPRRAKTRS